MWQKATLRQNPQIKQALESVQQGKVANVALAVRGTKLGVHNWTHGREEKSNRYLSPENAVKALSAKLTDYADPNRPKGRQDVVAFMVTSPTIDGFIADLQQAEELLPEPAFKQALDYAKSARDLQSTKMIKTPTQQHPAFSAGGDITPATVRSVAGVLRNANAAANALATKDPQAAIAALLKLKAERDKQNAQNIAQMLQASAPIYAFSASGELEIIAPQLAAGIPTPANVFTACLLFIGDDLTPLKGMINA